MRGAASIVIGLVCGGLAFLALSHANTAGTSHPAGITTSPVVNIGSATTPRAVVEWLLATDRTVKPQMAVVMQEALHILDSAAEQPFAAPSAGSEPHGQAWKAVIAHVSIGLERPQFNRDYAYFLAWCLKAAQQPASLSWQARGRAVHQAFAQVLAKRVQASLDSIPADRHAARRTASASFIAVSAEIEEQILRLCKNPFLPVWRDGFRPDAVTMFDKDTSGHVFPLWGAPSEIPDQPLEEASSAESRFLGAFRGKLSMYAHAMLSRLFAVGVIVHAHDDQGTPWGQLSYRMVNAHRHYWPTWVGFVPVHEALNRKIQP